MMSPEIFLSYAHADLSAARSVVAELEKRGFRCWFHTRDLPVGQPPVKSINEALRGSRVGIVLGSPAAESSSQVLRELEWLVINDRPVFLLQLGSTPPAGVLGEFLPQTTVVPLERQCTRAAWRQLEPLLRSAGLEPGKANNPTALERLSLPDKALAKRGLAFAGYAGVLVLLGLGLWLASVGPVRPELSTEVTISGPPIGRFTPVTNAESIVRVEPLPLGLAGEIRNSLGMKFALIPAGSFTRYSVFQSTELFTISLSRPYYLGVTEVTQQQFRALMDQNPSLFPGDLLPVHHTTWYEAVEFCRRLSELPAERGAGRSYRLPTESEWEFAARAGNGQRFFFGTDSSRLERFDWVAPIDKNYQPVGGKLPSPWGLYDIYGNAAEWCSDWSGDYPTESQTDPLGPKDGWAKIVRGGFIGGDPNQLHSGFRGAGAPEVRSCGFRVLCELAPDKLPGQAETRSNLR